MSFGIVFSERNGLLLALNRNIISSSAVTSNLAFHSPPDESLSSRKPQSRLASPRSLKNDSLKINSRKRASRLTPLNLLFCGQIL
jgi:hypothetical protein